MAPKPRDAKRVSVFGGEQQPSPTPSFYSMQAANSAYEEGAPDLFPDEFFVSPDAKRVKELEGQVEETEAEKELLRQQTEELRQQLASQSNGLAVQSGGLIVEGFQFSPKGLISPDTVSHDDWHRVGQLLFKLEGSIQWLIGDWLVYGQDLKYGDIDDIAARLGREPKTLYDYTYVSRNVPFSVRTENLSWAHHSRVAKMTLEYQAYALSFAEHHKYSLADFRAWIKLDMPEEGLPKELPSPIRSENTSYAMPKPAISGLEKIAQRDFATWKTKDRAAILKYAAEVQAWVNDLVTKAKG